MAYFKKPDGSIISVQFPELNLNLIAGLTEVDQAGNPIATTETPPVANIGATTDNIRNNQPNIYDSFDDFSNYLADLGWYSSQAESEYNTLLTDYNEYQTTQEEKAAERLERQREQIGQQYGEAITDVQELGERAVGGTKARATQPVGSGSTGLGVSSTLSQALAPIIKETNRQISDLQRRKDAAIANAEFASSEALDKKITAYRDRLDKLKEQEIKLKQDMFDKMMAVRNAQRADITTDIAIADQVADTPVGQTITIGGKQYTGTKVEELKPFWTSASLISLMKELPVGYSEERTDPITGYVYTITGLKEPTVNTQIFHSTNQNTGDETFTTFNKDTGEIIKQIISEGTGAVFKYGGGGRSAGSGGGGKTATALTFDEFLQGKIQGLSVEEVGKIMSSPEQYLEEYIKSQIGDTYIKDKAEARQFIDQVIQNSPSITYEQLYATADIATSLTATDIKSYLSLKGFKESIKEKTTPATQTMNDYLQSLKDQGYTENDIEQDFINDKDYGRVPDFVKTWLKENF